MKIGVIAKTTLAATVAFAALGGATIVHAHDHGNKAANAAPANIVGVAAGNENFETLVAAVKAAELVDTLSGEGPFTVFAPTDDAFGKLPDGTVGELVKPENKGTLTSILTYHVVAGKFGAKDVMKLLKANKGSASVDTVQGGKLTISSDSHGALMLTDAQGNKSKIIMTDVAASNGVIHVIDTVVMP
ncbi:fasciclin domain-containing protein [Sphingorhabdus arenilitoris]|uniref:Fasciclin domain-containing protein n=1 Tax=Sphingorhabdus arenilitoris TaxID=1490041 RepID=A0ABV8RFJ4_9SPHN